MYELPFPGSATPVKRVLCFGAHCDDIEIGLGATLRKLSRTVQGIDLRICVFSGDAQREAETREALSRMLGDSSSRSLIDVERFRNGHFPYCATEIKAHMETYKTFQPDVIFTHYRRDHHQDHKTISDLTANTFRNHLVLEYEILKYDGDLGNPNVFIAVSQDELDAKVEALMSSFKSQLDKQWFTADVFTSVARMRGVQCASPSGFAEAFYCNKMTLDIN